MNHPIIEFLKNFNVKQIIVAFICSGFFLYSLSFFNTFVLDDHIMIEDNVSLRSLSSIPNFFTTNKILTATGDYNANYRPVTLTVLTIIISIFGMQPFMLHFVQIVLHITIVILLFYFLKKFFSQSVSFVLSFLFLLHPLNAEAVLYMSNMQESLFLFFGILGTIFILYRNERWIHILTYILFILSILSKETGLIFLMIIPLYDVLYQKKQLWKHLFYSGITGSLYLFLRFIILHIQTEEGLSPISHLSLIQRLEHIPAIMSYYLSNFFWPLSLSVTQIWVIKTLSWSNFFFPLLINSILIGVFCFVCFSLFRTKDPLGKTLIFFGGVFLLSILPHLQIVPLTMTVADRWFYLPMISLLPLMYILAKYIVSKNWLHNNMVWYTLSLWMIFLTGITFFRVVTFYDGKTLVSHDLKQQHNNFLLENNLGYEYMKEGDLAQAQKYFKQAQVSNPQFVDSFFNSGLVLLITGATKQDAHTIELALQDFKKTIAINPRYQQAYEMIGVILFDYYPAMQAETFLQDATTKFPNSVKLFYTQAYVKNKLMKKDEAVRSAEKAYALQPSEENHIVLLRLQQNLPIPKIIKVIN